jgi:serine/threonine-protein kinase
MAEPESADPNARAWVGRELDGRFQLLELLGTGAMGSVYAAQHLVTSRRYALKLLHADLAGNPEIRQRFEREAMAIGRIKHPNCVDVSDFGKLEDGSMFLVMEFLEGSSLGEILEREECLDVARALRIIRHVARGLGHAHGHGIVHRDVKPENVIIIEEHGDTDFAKLLDFGIAKLLGEETNHGLKRLTRAGIAFGTPLYISPEQASGSTIDGRADIYSATVLLFELITGETPFDADEPLELLAKHTTQPPPTLSEMLGAPVADSVEALVAQGLAKLPSDRFDDAAEFVKAITQTLEAIGAGGPAFVGRSIGKDTTAPLLYGSLEPDETGPLPTSTGAMPAATPASTGALTSQAGYKSGAARMTPQMIIVLVAAVIAAGLLVAVLVRGTGGNDKKSAAMSPETLRASVTKLVDEGKAKAALALLDTQPEVVAGSADGQISLGIAGAAGGRAAAALEALRRAVELDPKVASDQRLRAALRSLLVAKSNVVANGAAKMAVRDLRDTAAADRLVAIASKYKTHRVRHRARAQAENFGLGKRVDRVASLMLDLRHRSRAHPCSKRRAVVKELRELNDPRAIPALQKAVTRRDRRGRRVNRCLVKDGKAAIKALRAGSR